MRTFQARHASSSAFAPVPRGPHPRRPRTSAIPVRNWSTYGLNATSRVSGLRPKPGTGRGCASELPSHRRGCLTPGAAPYAANGTTPRSKRDTSISVGASACPKAGWIDSPNCTMLRTERRMFRSSPIGRWGRIRYCLSFNEMKTLEAPTEEAIVRSSIMDPTMARSRFDRR